MSGPRHPRRPEHFASRRIHERGRRRKRNGDSSRLARIHERAHLLRDHASTEHLGSRGPHCRHRRRQSRRGRLPWRTDAHQSPLRAPLRGPFPTQSGLTRTIIEMESTRSPIQHAPLSLILVATAFEPVEALIAAWLPFIENSPAGSQLIVIADHPIECHAGHTRLRIVYHTRPMGVGACLQTGIWSLETPLVFFVSTTRLPPSEQKSDFLERIDKVDLVNG